MSYTVSCTILTYINHGYQRFLPKQLPRPLNGRTPSHRLGRGHELALIAAGGFGHDGRGLGVRPVVGYGQLRSVRGKAGDIGWLALIYDGK